VGQSCKTPLPYSSRFWQIGLLDRPLFGSIPFSLRLRRVPPPGTSAKEIRFAF